jgi:hypothetical protein
MSPVFAVSYVSGTTKIGNRRQLTFELPVGRTRDMKQVGFDKPRELRFMMNASISSLDARVADGSI